MTTPLRGHFGDMLLTDGAMITIPRRRRRAAGRSRHGHAAADFATTLITPPHDAAYFAHYFSNTKRR